MAGTRSINDTQGYIDLYNKYALSDEQVTELKETGGPQKASKAHFAILLGQEDAMNGNTLCYFFCKKNNFDSTEILDDNKNHFTSGKVFIDDGVTITIPDQAVLYNLDAIKYKKRDFIISNDNTIDTNTTLINNENCFVDGKLFVDDGIELTIPDEAVLYIINPNECNPCH